MYKNHKVIYEKNGYKVIRAENNYGKLEYFLCDCNGKYIRDFSSVCDVSKMPELFPNLSKPV